MVEINTHDYVFPIIAGESGGTATIVKNVLGTAFSIGGGYFLTCDHVLKNGDGFGEVRLGRSNLVATKWESIVILGNSRHEDLDVAILYVPHAKDIQCMEWEAPEKLPMLSTVHATGFPYALNLPDEGSIQIRSFCGTITSVTIWPKFKSKPGIYELSFLAPRGLSGAPLCRGNKIVGVVYGNRSIEMTVFSETEVNKDGDETTVFEKIESFRIGLALQTEPIMNIESDLLKCTVGEHLKKHALLCH